jgi:formylmethanofuran dehydrogenase subunit E
MEIKDIKFDERNYRIHSEKNKQLIRKSINECGLARSVVVDNENCLIGGNGVVSQLDKNTKVKVIETDGSELVVVKRTDLKTDDEKRKKLAIMDNSTSDTSEFDIELLKTDFEIPELQDLGLPVFEESDIDVDSFFEDTEEKEKKKKTITCPHCGEEIEV